MPRIAGIDIPADKPIFISLTYIYGIGRTLSKKILKELNIDENLRAKNLHDDQLSALGAYIEKNYVVEGYLRRQENQNIALLKNIGSYRGLRHKMGLPVRGQRTSTNARTRKGKRRTVAGKKETPKG
ncbi:MAG: 30S ribosomal protein S13 [Planctomycetes bacterium RIFCSPHIGHO2_02_FULL_50_42]|jgi:small subunit ribosomal protein S13|uniref:Small ribosomal subunit protein uS13 n=1 Tax=uncultured planctomycete Rifle_16ft_4_minimus_3099 TaxID=1665203 RepID=A0A0H4T5J1_9BACT|nr:30S ribosomal protein S13, small subunit ribosomal protein S13 [uncultured planctomycete Rifle_16ft_4_minimus_3099]MDO8125793.1 30S ribosomal protein S13 [Candidatus Brocadiales bacterium]OHB37095.1 MAG: 30S ribosomal protein S13 [Planctomycetes bacterium GWA2_50_13]OHB89897.1 MAG: 30S ribosomal protein S13 [Planctomycetes bacterium RIFCSPHIGHO2_02_FULL_50_42]OHB91394.1 MAG: 30S ribosomal protein S13 [Planctomycetes bacterium RIFCSPHIGHO2_12_FULL_51_37]OHB95508.1 MAG: 30S ribosomal protein 